MFNIRFKIKFKKNLKINFDQSDMKLVKNEFAFNKQIHKKGEVLISEGACLAYVFLFLKTYGDFLIKANKNIINFDEFFVKLKVELKHQKNYSYLYYWMGVQHEFNTEYNNNISNKKGSTNIKKLEQFKVSYKNLNPKSNLLDVASLIVYCFYISSNSYSLQMAGLKWSYEGTINECNKLEESLKFIFDFIKMKDKTPKYDIFFAINIGFQDPDLIFRFFDKTIHYHAMNVVFSKSASRRNIIFFDPNFGVYHFIEMDNFKEFAIAILDGVYRIKKFVAHAFVLK